MKFISALSFTDPAHFAALAIRAEACGWHALSLSDHVFYPVPLASAYPYAEDGKPSFDGSTPWVDPWVAIGAMAAVTERLQFLTNVYVLSLRHPLEVAKSLGTAAYMSGGRVSLGIGVGWMREEFVTLGEDFHTRGRRTDEAIEILRKVWSGDVVEHRGDHYEFSALQMSPAVSPVPVLAGGLSDAALRRAARNQGWISVMHPEDELRDYVATLRRHRKELGREGEPLEVLASCTDVFDPDGYRRLEDAGVTGIITMPWLLYGGDGTKLDDKLEGFERFAEDVIRKLQ